MSKPNEKIETFAGIAGTPYTLAISPQYVTNEISVTGGSGRIAIRAKQKDNNAFEEVAGGYINRTSQATVTIGDYQLKELEFTQTETQAFTVYVTQSNPVEVT